MKVNKTKCLGVGGEIIQDECTPNVGKLWGSLFSTLIVIQTYSSGHFLFGSSLIFKYALPRRKYVLVIINFCCFMLLNCFTLNGFFFDKVEMLVKIVFILTINTSLIFAISRFIGHPKPFLLMKNYFYFEFFICSIPTIAILFSLITYPNFIKSGSKNMALFLTSIFNAIFDYIFSEIIMRTVLAHNKFLETIDLMPGVSFLTGYFDGLFFGNLLPQDVDSFGFWFNLLVYYGLNIAEISGIKGKILKYYNLKRKKKKKFHGITAIDMVRNGAQFYTVLPLILTVTFAYLNTPYLYGSQLYDYIKFDWKETTGQYNYEPLVHIFSIQKLSIIIGFSLLFLIAGVFWSQHYAFCEITFTIYLKNIFYTFKICAMFTFGFEYSIIVANVVENNILEEILSGYRRVFGLN